MLIRRALICSLALAIASGCSSSSSAGDDDGAAGAAGSTGTPGTTTVDLPEIADVLVTPEDRFNNLSGYDFEPQFVELGDVRMHYVDEGPKDGFVVLMLHGEPSWAYLYRTMVPVITAAGHRAVVPDLIGFGRSDKPSQESDHTYKRHVDWVLAFVELLDLQEITLVIQDWGGLIGLRLAAENPDRIRLIVVSNTFLPTGDEGAAAVPELVRMGVENGPISNLLQGGTVGNLSPDVLAAYDAPYPDDSFKAGPLALPTLVPVTPNDPASDANRAAWEVLRGWEKPFLTAHSDNDPFLGPLDALFQAAVPGAEGQPHTRIPNAGHFVQEDNGEALAQVTVDFMAANPPL